MDWETLYCPNRLCRLYGVVWRQSALVKNGTSRGYRQAICRACGQSVFLRYGTAYFELEADPAIFDTAQFPKSYANWPRRLSQNHLTLMIFSPSSESLSPHRHRSEPQQPPDYTQRHHTAHTCATWYTASVPQCRDAEAARP
jgi:hypothetical protein